MKNDRVQINDLFDHLYEELKEDIKVDNDLNYDAYVFKQPPVKPVMPHVQVQFNATPVSESLDKKENKWRVGVEVNIFAQDTGYFNKRTIVRDLQEKVFDFFYHEYGFELSFDRETPNLDARVLRHTLRFRAVYDLDTGIIYRR